MGVPICAYKIRRQRGHGKFHSLIFHTNTNTTTLTNTITCTHKTPTRTHFEAIVVIHVGGHAPTLSLPNCEQRTQYESVIMAAFRGVSVVMNCQHILGVRFSSTLCGSCIVFSGTHILILLFAAGACNKYSRTERELWQNARREKQLFLVQLLEF